MSAQNDLRILTLSIEQFNKDFAEGLCDKEYASEELRDIVGNKNMNYYTLTNFIRACNAGAINLNRVWVCNVYIR